VSGFYMDPRLPALGWRGYGVEPPAESQPTAEPAYDHHRLTLGVPTGVPTAPTPSRPTSTC
jgi:hypothetical protein